MHSLQTLAIGPPYPPYPRTRKNEAKFAKAFFKAVPSLMRYKMLDLFRAPDEETEGWHSRSRGVAKKGDYVCRSYNKL